MGLLLSRYKSTIADWTVQDEFVGYTCRYRNLISSWFEVDRQFGGGTIHFRELIALHLPRVTKVSTYIATLKTDNPNADGKKATLRLLVFGRTGERGH